MPAWKLFFVISIVGVTGCAHFQEKKKVRYDTVTPSSKRDEAKAARHSEKAEKHFHKGNLQKAEQELQLALIADVSFGPAHNNLGKLYFHQGKYYLAAWEFEYAIRVMPGVAEPQNNLGLVYEDVGRLDEAESYFSAAHQLDSTNPEYLGNLIRTRLEQDERDPAVRPLLEQLLLFETRPRWREWAKKVLAVGKFPEYEYYSETTLNEQIGAPVVGQSRNEYSPSEPLPRPTPIEFQAPRNQTPRMQ